MEILIITGVIALAGLSLLALRVLAGRRSLRTAGGARQWGGSAGASRRAHGARSAAAAAGGGGGAAVQEPPRSREGALDAWDDDLEWTDGLDAAPEEAAPVARGKPGPSAPAPAH